MARTQQVESGASSTEGSEHPLKNISRTIPSQFVFLERKKSSRNMEGGLKNKENGGKANEAT